MGYNLTVEVVVMNTLAVALATDSAVTVGDVDKIFSSANKLFMLSKHHPVGIMVYDNANILNIPWETIIKIYRKKIGSLEKETILDYTNDFIKFLNKNIDLFPVESQKEYFKQMLSAHFSVDIEDLDSKIKEALSESKNGIDESQVKNIVDSYIDELFSLDRKFNYLNSLGEQDAKQILRNYKAEIDEIIDLYYQELPIGQRKRNVLRKYAANLLIKDYSGLDIVYPLNTGIVIAGFGKNDVYPIVTNFSIRTVLDNKIIMDEIEINKITHDSRAAILPFAQIDMVQIFMNGVSNNYRKWIDDYVEMIYDEIPTLLLNDLNINESDKELIEDKLIEIGQKQYELFLQVEEETIINNWRPIIEVVRALPKDELARMAETLVNITLFKTRISVEPETVGGPIDVAVISKGDGFIWIKRKHYFVKELNPYYFKKEL